MKSTLSVKNDSKSQWSEIFFSLKYMISCIFKTKDRDEDDYFYHSVDFRYLNDNDFTTIIQQDRI